MEGPGAGRQDAATTASEQANTLIVNGLIAEILGCT
jgi:hypothetical protein